MADPLLTTNYSSSYLKFLAGNFDKKTGGQGDIGMPEIMANNSVANQQVPSDSFKISSKSQEKKPNWEYLSGVAAAGGQLISGACIMLGAALGKKGKASPKLVNTLDRIGWWSMGLSYFVSMPSCIGASLKALQPSMLLGTAIWGISSPFMLLKRFQGSARLIASTPLGAGFIYAGMANKVKNENELKEGEKPKIFDFKQVNKHNFISKTGEMLECVAEDLAVLPKTGIKAISQGWDYITGKRKEAPEFWTIKPTQNNSRLASLLLLPGAIMLMAFGRKYKSVERLANVLIGVGLMSEAMYMYTLGNEKKGFDKAFILAGVPLRTIGDFGQTNPFMLGMRTMGGASFEYYFATLNKEEELKKQELSNKTSQL